MAHRKTATELLHRLKTNFKSFHRKRLGHVTADVFEKWRTRRLTNGKSHQVVNRDLDDIRGVLSKAELWGYITSNPLRKIRKFKSDRMLPVRHLTAAEETALFDALADREGRIRKARWRTNEWRKVRELPLLPTLHNQRFADYLIPMIVLSLNTGMRRSEIFDLHWRDVDLVRKFVSIRGENAKNSQTRYIPLNSVGLTALRDWQAQSPENADLVFPSRNGARLESINSAWKAVLMKAGVSKFRWHDLRHTFASRLVMKGVALNTVRELLGHTDCQMTLRYAHLAPEHTAAAVERLVA